MSNIFVDSLGFWMIFSMCTYFLFFFILSFFFFAWCFFDPYRMFLWKQGLPGIHLFCARFKEQIGDIFGARAAFLQCGSDLESDFIENVARKANMEKRLVLHLTMFFLMSRDRLLTSFICISREMWKQLQLYMRKHLMWQKRSTTLICLAFFMLGFLILHTW